MIYLLLVAAVVFLAGGVYVLTQRGWAGWWIASGFGVAAVVMVWFTAMLS